MPTFRILQQDISSPEVEELANMLCGKNKNELIAWCSSRELNKSQLAKVRDILAHHDRFKHAAVVRDMLTPVDSLNE